MFLVKLLVKLKNDNYNINHLKLSVVLWKALQEQILKNEEKDKKIEHLEATVYEIMNDIKELKGKGKAKAKAKAKAKKSKDKSDDDDEIYSNIQMGNRHSTKQEENNSIKELEGMDDSELSAKDKIFKKAILDLKEEIKEVKNQKKDKLIYAMPKVDLCNMSLF